MRFILLILVIYLPFVTSGEPQYNEYSLDLFLDSSLPPEDAWVWMYLDPTFGQMDLNPYFDYQAPYGYRITGPAIMYFYEDGSYRWIQVVDLGVEYCPAFADIEGSICVTQDEHTYTIRNQSNFTIDVIQIHVEPNQ